MAIIEKKYCVLYNSDKSILTLLFSKNQSINTLHKSFGTDSYQDLVDFIYNNNLYEDDKSNINYKKLNRLEENVEETLLKYDD
jgi:hypothetical protein|tara:strand:+ start:931 stop:1179 length:249 start_codon:yes stop_codon:yes gene_type:complete